MSSKKERKQQLGIPEKIAKILKAQWKDMYCYDGKKWVCLGDDDSFTGSSTSMIGRKC